MIFSGCLVVVYLNLCERILILYCHDVCWCVCPSFCPNYHDVCGNVCQFLHLCYHGEIYRIFLSCCVDFSSVYPSPHFRDWSCCVGVKLFVSNHQLFSFRQFYFLYYCSERVTFLLTNSPCLFYPL